MVTADGSGQALLTTNGQSGARAGRSHGEDEASHNDTGSPSEFPSGGITWSICSFPPESSAETINAADDEMTVQDHGRFTSWISSRPHGLEFASLLEAHHSDDWPDRH